MSPYETLVHTYFDLVLAKEAELPFGSSMLRLELEEGGASLLMMLFVSSSRTTEYAKLLPKGVRFAYDKRADQSVIAQKLSFDELCPTSFAAQALKLVSFAQRS